MAQIIVEGAPRDTRGKNEARRLRVSGRVPATLYGGKGEAVALAVNTKQVTAILRSESGHNTLFQVDLGGKQEPAIVKDWQVDPVTGNLLHVDLLRIAMDVRMKVTVPVNTFGEPSGVKVQGGVYEVVLREVEVECLPADIPSFIEVDVSELTFGKVLRVADLPHSGKLKFLTDENQPVAHIISIKEEVVATPEAAAAEAAASPAEPEVIKKGKQEAEGEEAAEAPAEKAEKKEKEKK